jgi:hypothetical protein
VNEFLSYLSSLFSLFVGDGHDTAISHSVQNGRELKPFSLITLSLTPSVAAPTRSMIFADRDLSGLAIAQAEPASICTDFALDDREGRRQFTGEGERRHI